MWPAGRLVGSSEGSIPKPGPVGANFHAAPRAVSATGAGSEPQEEDRPSDVRVSPHGLSGPETEF